MKPKALFFFLVLLHHPQIPHGLLTIVSASPRTLNNQSKNTDQSVPANRYKLGQPITVKESLTLKLVKGSSKSIELFASKQITNETPLVLDVEFNGPTDKGYVFFWGLSEDKDKSDSYLQAGEERIAPEGFAAYSNVEGDKPLVARITDMNIVETSTGKRFAMVNLRESKKVVSFLFDLKGKQLGQAKELIVSFAMGKDQNYSFVIEIN
jgi:hypothetical protein